MRSDMEMIDDKTFYTATMARLHADQGRYEAAIKIYRYLLEQMPDREDLKAALETVTAKLPEKSGQRDEVCVTVGRWVRLLLRLRELRRLEQTRVPTSGADG